MKTKDLLDQEIIDGKIKKLLLDRDAGFLHQLFIEVNPYLARICSANGYFKEEMEELVQQAWERFFMNLEKFEGRSQIRTYICGILFNKIREYRRLQKRIVFEEDCESFMNQSFTEDGWWRKPPPDPLRISELRQSSEFIKACMEGLSQQQVEAFVLTEIEEHSSDEICAAMEVKVSHLRVLLFRAKDKLRKCIEGKMQESVYE